MEKAKLNRQTVHAAQVFEWEPEMNQQLCKSKITPRGKPINRHEFQDSYTIYSPANCNHTPHQDDFFFVWVRNNHRGQNWTLNQDFCTEISTHYIFRSEHSVPRQYNHPIQDNDQWRSMSDESLGPSLQASEHERNFSLMQRLISWKVFTREARHAQMKIRFSLASCGYAS